MDTDDIAMPIRAEEQLNVFEKYPDVDVVGAWVNEFIDDISNIISVRKLPEWHDEILRFAQKRNPMNHPVVMFKKSAVVAAGGYQHFPFLEIILQRQMRFRISDFCASDKKTGDFTEKVTVSPCIIPKNRIFCNFFEGKLVGIK